MDSSSHSGNTPVIPVVETVRGTGASPTSSPDPGVEAQLDGFASVTDNLQVLSKLGIVERQLRLRAQQAQSPKASAPVGRRKLEKQRRKDSGVVDQPLPPAVNWSSFPQQQLNETKSETSSLEFSLVNRADCRKENWHKLNESNNRLHAQCGQSTSTQTSYHCSTLGHSSSISNPNSPEASKQKALVTFEQTDSYVTDFNSLNRLNSTELINSKVASCSLQTESRRAPTEAVATVTTDYSSNTSSDRLIEQVTGFTVPCLEFSVKHNVRTRTVEAIFDLNRPSQQPSWKTLVKSLHSAKHHECHQAQLPQVENPVQTPLTGADVDAARQATVLETDSVTPQKVTEAVDISECGTRGGAETFGEPDIAENTYSSTEPEVISQQHTCVLSEEHTTVVSTRFKETESFEEADTDEYLPKAQESNLQCHFANTASLPREAGTARDNYRPPKALLLKAESRRSRDTQHVSVLSEDKVPCDTPGVPDFPEALVCASQFEPNKSCPFESPTKVSNRDIWELAGDTDETDSSRAQSLSGQVSEASLLTAVESEDNRSNCNSWLSIPSCLDPRVFTDPEELPKTNGTTTSVLQEVQNFPPVSTQSSTGLEKKDTSSGERLPGQINSGSNGATDTSEELNSDEVAITRRDAVAESNRLIYNSDAQWISSRLPVILDVIEEEGSESQEESFEQENSPRTLSLHEETPHASPSPKGTENTSYIQPLNSPEPLLDINGDTAVSESDQSGSDLEEQPRVSEGPRESRASSSESETDSDDDDDDDDDDEMPFKRIRFRDASKEGTPDFTAVEVQVEKARPVADHYDVKQKLGRGKFGEVKLGLRRTDGKEFALKFIEARRAADKALVQSEVEAMKELQHPRLLQLFAVYEERRAICLVLEIIRGGELFERVLDDTFDLTEDMCRHVLRQVCEAVSFIHSRHFIHLDLKPENILCLTPRGIDIKIIDFGLSRKFDPRHSTQVMAGTAEFCAPEVVNYDPICFKTDMWAIGVITYILISGLSPFLGDTDMETLSNVTAGEWDFDDPAFDDVSPECKDFMSGLIQKDKRRRSTAEVALRHAWIEPEKKKPAKKVARSLSKRNHKKFVARRKWQRAVNTMRALQRMGIDLSKLRQTEGSEDELEI